jgi:hypothetical protein
MLKEIITNQKLERQKQLEKIAERNKQYHERMNVLKNQLEELSDNLLILEIKESGIVISNIKTPVIINGTIDNLRVSGLGLFSLMGEKHTVESLFKKVAPYLIIKNQ